MTRSSAAYVNANTANAPAYLAFQGVLSAQLNAVLTKTTDTGQLGSFNAIPTASVRDYEVFRFNDSLQATAPIFIKVNWAMDPTTFTYMNVTVGTTTNGAGALGGVTVPNLALYGYQASTGLTRYCYASSDGSQLMFAANVQPQGSNTGEGLAAIIVERTRDADGTPNAYGYMVYHFKATTDSSAVGTTTLAGVYARSNDTTAVQPAVAYDLGVIAPNIVNANSYLIGTTAYALPASGWGTAMMGASKALMLGFPGDWPKDTAVVLTHYGTPMTFLALPQVGVNVAYMSSASATAVKTLSPLLRWE